MTAAGGGDVVIVALGTRGDVAPYTGLGVRLTEAGYTVSIATQRPFAELVTGCGLRYREIPGDPRAILGSPAGRRTQGTGPRALAGTMRMLREGLREIGDGMIAALRRDTDAALLSMSAIPFGYHIAEGLGIPSAGAVLVPIHATGDFPPPGLSRVPVPGRWGNRLLARAGAAGTERLFRPHVDRLRGELGLPRLSTRGLHREQDARRWPVLCGYSPTVLPRPRDWRDGVDVAGYWWPARPTGWRPPARLLEFLDAGPAPVCISLGSMATDGREGLAGLFAAALRRAGVRGIVQSGWADLAPDESDDLLTVGEVPHDWLFPRMAAVVHHAGAGTTAAGLRAGVPAVGVPVWLDQPIWAARLVRLGVSPATIPLRRLTVDGLTAAIRAAVTEPAHRERARHLAARIAAEDGAGRVASVLGSLCTRSSA